MAVEPADVEYGLSLLRARQDRDRTFRNYYDGLADTSHVPTELKAGLTRLLRTARLNRCKGVVDALADRVTVVGWDVTGGPRTPIVPDPNDATAQDPIVAHALDVWRRTRMANRQNELVKEVFRAGDGYLIVWPDDDPGSPDVGKACFYPNPAHTTTVVYDAEYPDRVAYAVKAWQVSRGLFKGRWRVTVYDDEVISRYITIGKPDNVPVKANQLEPYVEDGQPETPNDYGVVPVIHFGNDADTGSYGTSELADVIGLQDGLNNSVCRTIIAEEFASFPQKWVVGLEPEDDPTNPGQKLSPFQVGVQKLLVAANAETKFGQFEAANMEQILKVREAWTLDIATVSRTPIHWFEGMGAATSGEQLKVSEAAFVSKVKDRTAGLTDPYAAAMRLALVIEGEAPDAVAGLEPVWMPAESRSEQEFWTVAQLKIQAGVPQERVWQESGYTPDEIAEMVKLKAEAAQRQQQAFAGAFGGTTNTAPAPFGGGQQGG